MRPNTPVGLVGRYGAQSVRVPVEEAARVDRLVADRGGGAGGPAGRDAGGRGARPPDAQSVEVQRHLLLTLLLRAERHYDHARADGSLSDDGDTQLRRRFAALLERDFGHHHDVGHYADGMGVPTAVPVRALSHSTGRPTKALITDRVMLEAARLLRLREGAPPLGGGPTP
ncbi:hypothetical protein ABT186_03165 [Streptomyces sp. NPDC001634]|uniref:hypothetical protein n=1 Tax=Streptomyces sp. NPDC001634 TaxID=3154390 RepID=UPI00331662C0